MAVNASTFLPAINGLEELNSGNYELSLKHFTRTRPAPFIQYHAARARKSLGQFPAALSALQDLRTLISLFESNSVYSGGDRYKEYVAFYPRSYYLEGTIYEAMNEKAKAVRSYETFLGLWKDADRDIPELIDAKRRLALLR